MSEDSAKTSRRWLTHTRAAALVFLAAWSAIAWMAMDYANLYAKKTMAEHTCKEASVISKYINSLTRQKTSRESLLRRQAQESLEILSAPENMITRIASCLVQSAPDVRFASLKISESEGDGLAYEFQAGIRVSGQSWHDVFPILQDYRDAIIRNSGPLTFEKVAWSKDSQAKTAQCEIAALLKGQAKGSAKAFAAESAGSYLKAAEEYARLGNTFKEANCLQRAADQALQEISNKFSKDRAEKIKPIIQTYENAAKLYAASGAGDQAALALVYLAKLYAHELRKTEKVMECLDRARKIALSEKDSYLEALCLQAMGEVHKGNGQLDKAAKSFEDAMLIMKQLGRTTELYFVRSFWAEEPKK